MPVKPISVQVTTQQPATYTWSILSSNCPNLGQAPVGGTLNTGTTTITETIIYPNDCLLVICLNIFVNNDCVESVCFNMNNNTTFEDSSWNCGISSEGQKVCVLEQSLNGQFSTEQECITCLENTSCASCGISCTDFNIEASYDCTIGLSLVWTTQPYEGNIECISYSVNTIDTTCTSNVLATNIAGTNISSLNGTFFPSGTYSINIVAQLENGCKISSNSVVIVCQVNPQVEWNLECCQSVDTSGTTAGYLDKFYILDITSNDTTLPLYVDFSFFQVADRLKFYDFSQVAFSQGLPTNLTTLTPIADTGYVGKPLSCYTPAVSANLSYGFVEITNTSMQTQQQTSYAIQALNPVWSLLMPCNDNYTQSFTSPLNCSVCTNLGASYNIPKNCAVNVPACEPVDIIGCGRLTIDQTALATILPNTLGRKKIFVHLESNDCSTGCTAAVFKIVCPHCLNCTNTCDVSYSCASGLELSNCTGNNIYKYCYNAFDGLEVCTEFNLLDLPIYLPNNDYTIKIINQDQDNCVTFKELSVNCSCTLPTIRSAGGACLLTNPNIGHFYVSYTEAIVNAFVRFSVQENTGQFNNLYLRYGNGCDFTNCTNWIKLIYLGNVGGTDTYETQTTISLDVFGGIFGLFDSSFTNIDMPDGTYTLSIYYNSSCFYETPITVACDNTCTTPQFKSWLRGCFQTNAAGGYFSIETISSHTTLLDLTLKITNAQNYTLGQYANKFLKINGLAGVYNGAGTFFSLNYLGLISGADTYSITGLNFNSPRKVFGIYDSPNIPIIPIDCVNADYEIILTDQTCSNNINFNISCP